VCGNGCAELCEHDRCGDAVVGGDPQGVSGAVVKPGQDLGVEPGASVGAGESVVGEVGLPGFVGHRGFEADVGRLRSLLRLRDHQTGLDQMPGHRGPRHRQSVVVFQVPPDGVRACVQAGGGQLLTELHDQLDHRGGSRVRVGPGPSGAGLEDRLALDAVAGQQLIEPGLGHAVLGGDLRYRTVLDHHGGDQQSGI
jgi:hypothetical protein